MNRDSGELDRITPIDPDILLITDYLAGELSPEQEAVVEARLVDDEAFFEKVSPAILVWTMPIDFDELESGGDLEMPLSLPMTVPAPEPLAIAPKPRRSLRRRIAYYSAGSAAALLLLFLFAGGPGGVMATLFTGSKDSADVRAGHAPKFEVQGGKVTETKAGETVTDTLKNGALVTVRPGSRLQWRTPLFYMPVDEAALDGEAAFELPEGKGLVLLRTSVGNLKLSTGAFAVRCAPGCEAMLVTAGRGTAVLVDGMVRPILTIGAGQFARVPRKGAAELTKGGDDYPKLAHP
jgi:hypothetical protein